MKTVIKFSYEGCQPCKQLSPIFTKVAHEFAQEFAEQYQFVEIDVDQKPDVASSYGIRSIPTLVITDEADTVLATKAGVMSEQQLKEFIQGCSNN
jgi:thioredoxin 1